MKKISPKTYILLIVGIMITAVGIFLLSSHNTKYEKIRQQMEYFVNQKNLDNYSWSLFSYTDSNGKEVFAPVGRRDVEKNAKDSMVSYVLDELYGSGWCALHKTGGIVLIALGVLCCCTFCILLKYALEPDSVKEERRLEKIKQHEQAQKQAQINAELHRKALENERQQAINSQKYGAHWDTKYFTDPCPYCGHYKVRFAKWEDKRMSIAFWGAASSKIGTKYKCEHCSRMWS